MSFRARQPGCPCCEDDCRIEITGWNQVAGTWTITGDNLETASSSGLAVTTNAHPEAKSTHVVIVSVKGNTDGDILRVVIAYDDADNYLFGEIEVGNDCGYLRLFQRDAGSVFQLGDDVPVLDLAPGVSHTVRLCYDGTTLTILLAGKAAYSRDVTASGQRVGVATGAITTLATFTGFEWWIHYDDGGYYGEPNDCPECDFCLIMRDYFDRADGPPGCEWSVTGAAEIESGALHLNTGTAAVARPAPEGVGWHVAFYAKFLQDGDQLAVRVGKILLEFTVDLDPLDNRGCDLVVTHDDDGILRDEKLGNITIEQFHGFVFCLDENSFTSIIVGADDETDYISRGISDAGYASGISFSHDAVIDLFDWNIHYSNTHPDCPRCQRLLPCDVCTDNEWPWYWKLTFEGITQKTNGFCNGGNNCEDFNRTVIIPFGAWGSRGAYPDDCGVSQSGISACDATGSGMGLGFTRDKTLVGYEPDGITPIWEYTGTYTIKARHNTGTDLGDRVGFNGNWQIVLNEQIDCKNLYDLVLPFYGYDNPASTRY